MRFILAKIKPDHFTVTQKSRQSAKMFMDPLERFVNLSPIMS